jgi:hypothetical protein
MFSSMLNISALSRLNQMKAGLAGSSGCWPDA